MRTLKFEAPRIPSCENILGKRVSFTKIHRMMSQARLNYMRKCYEIGKLLFGKALISFLVKCSKKMNDAGYYHAGRIIKESVFHFLRRFHDWDNNNQTRREAKQGWQSWLASKGIVFKDVYHQIEREAA